jgi:hypothetical protein
MKKALTTDQQTPVPVTPAPSQDDATVPDVGHVLLPTVPESGLRLYSDGSHRYREQTGTYAWEVGYYDKDLWLQIATGGGKCSQKDNPHVPLTSTRLEALGVLRGRQWIEQNQWQGKVEAWLDNESTVTRFAKHQTERHKKCWKRPDNDIWSAMREIDPTRTTLHWVEGHPEKRKAPWQYDEHEQRNVAMDKAAEEQYGARQTDRGQPTQERSVSTTYQSPPKSKTHWRNMCVRGSPQNFLSVSATQRATPPSSTWAS